jgi:hypothetical protein
MYFDYRFRFPADGLTQAVAAFDALRAAGILPADSLPSNMLGDPIEQDGKVVAFGRSGRAGLTYIDPDTAETVVVPAIGDPGMVYVHIRSEVAPDGLPAGFDPSVFGLVPVSAEDSAAVLGVWA